MRTGTFGGDGRGDRGAERDRYVQDDPTEEAEPSPDPHRRPAGTVICRRLDHWNSATCWAVRPAATIVAPFKGHHGLATSTGNVPRMVAGKMRSRPGLVASPSRTASRTASSWPRQVLDAEAAAAPATSRAATTSVGAATTVARV